ncbi:hypothetical protein [Natronosalvus halobius]|uniref:hypothetical protein n=1 Tax=Natronosalvus halobius TaxID=2953746 RepID=UPI00209D7258|nr:hypothetical protein [Natronosalvus halobius]USZ71100.1 hypothetical protein NGM15_13540 [Natronosalvus halobius]
MRYETESLAWVYENELRVEARGDDGASEIAEIEMEKFVDPWGRSSDWQTASIEEIDDTGEWYTTRFDFRDERYQSNVKPDTVIVTVTDIDGNQLVIEDDRKSGTTKLYAGFAAAGTAGAKTVRATRPVASLGLHGRVAVAVSVGAVAGGTFAHSLATSTTYSGEEVHDTYPMPVPPTPSEGTWETPEGLEITLPSGAVYEDPMGQGHDRGFGWEYIEETTDLTVGEIGHAVENAEKVVDDGEVRYIIGDGYSETDRVILSIIGGTIVTASASSAYNEDCGATVRFDESGNPEHALRDGKPIDEVTTLIEVIENPTRIVDAGSKRYYILKLGTNRVIMVSTRLYDQAYQALRTTLTGKGPDNAFRTVDEAMEEIERKHSDYKIVHDPENGIEC